MTHSEICNTKETVKDIIANLEKAVCAINNTDIEAETFCKIEHELFSLLKECKAYKDELTATAIKMEEEEDE